MTAAETPDRTAALVEAALFAVGVLENLSSEEFAHGGDEPAREALTSAIRSTWLYPGAHLWYGRKPYRDTLRVTKVNECTVRGINSFGQRVRIDIGDVKRTEDE